MHCSPTRSRAGHLARGILALAGTLGFLGGSALAQGPVSTSFTYQGELAQDGSLATGLFDLRFRLLDSPTNGAQIGATLCVNDLTVTNGRFTVSLDFGSQYNGQKRFLEVLVRPDSGLACADTSGYATLSPRQELTAAPYASSALTAGSAATAATATTATTATTAGSATMLNGQPPSFYTNAANLTGTLPPAALSGTYGGTISLTSASNTFVGTGAGLTQLNAANISAGTLNAARLPTNWAAGGDLTGTFPSPTIGAGTVTRSKLSQDVLSALATSGSDWALTPFQSVGSAATGARPRSVAVSGSYAYVVAANSTALQVFNISNPSAPVLTGSVGTNPGVFAVTVSGSHAYVTSYNASTVQVFNVSNPASPTLASTINLPNFGCATCVVGTRAYVFSASAGRVYDVSNPASPTPLGPTFPIGGSVNAVAMSGSFAYVLSQANGILQLFNLSNPANVPLPLSQSAGNTPIGIALSDSQAYVINNGSDTLQVFTANNTFPGLVATVPTGHHPSSVAVSGNFAYVTSENGNLEVFNISDPAHPTSIGTIGTNAAPSCVALGGPIAYVTSETANTLQAFRGGINLQFNTPLFAPSLTGIISASSITTGTIPPARLPATLARTDVSNTFGAFTNTFNGSIVLSGAPSNDVPLFSFRGAGATHTSAVFSDAINSSFRIGHPTSAVVAIGGNEGHDLRFGGFQNDNSNFTPYMTVKAFGLVGINTTSPTHILTMAGNANCTGLFSKGGGSFQIDHPLDPENKYLFHSFVESPDMMNVYNGTIITDSSGYAQITLPDYFEALNRDFRYQLTVIDEDDADDVILWAKVVRKVGTAGGAPNQFTVRTFRGNVEVSWQVTGIRKDAFAEKNRIIPDVEKAPAHKGKYLHPDAFGKPEAQSIYPKTSAQANEPVATHAVAADR